MKSKLLLLNFLLLLLFTKTNAQTWGSVGGADGFDGDVYCLFADEANNILYAGGDFKNVDGVAVNGIAKWDGTKWSAMSTGFTSTSSYPATVFTITIYKNELYAGGHFTKAGGTTANGVAKWDGTKWVEVGGGISTTGFYPHIQSFQEFNGELYASGEFSTIGSATTNSVAKWNGTSWTDAGGTFYSDIKGRVNSLYAHKGELYRVGHFVIDKSGNFQYRIAKLGSGTNWVNLGSGLGDATAGWHARTMTTYKDNLYVGGRFNVLESGSVQANDMAMWNGSSWSAVGTAPNVGVTSTSTTYHVRKLIVYDNKLFVGGDFTAAGGASNSGYLATWDGTKWEGVNGSDLDGEIITMAVFNGELIIGGAFKKAGGATRNKIAKLSIPNSIKKIQQNLEATVMPNPVDDMAKLVMPGNMDIVDVHIYDISGRVVKKLNGVRNNDIIVRKGDFQGGIYYYKIIAGGEIATGKLMMR